MLVMKAALVHASGEMPVYADFAAPIAAAGENRVRVTASAISHLARSRASGRHYSSRGSVPFVAGIDGVGRLEDGRRVFFAMPRAPYGALAQETVVRAEHCLDVPDGLDDVTAAAIASPGLSSWAALTERARLQRGETVLINGATGISGRLAVQIARHLGAGRVIATGRNADALAAVGANTTIVLTAEGDALETRCKAVFAAGVDVVVDYLWGESAACLLVAAAKAAPEAVPIRFVPVGAASGADITLPSAVLRASSLVLMGSGIGSIPLERLLAAISGVLAAAGSAGLRIATRTVPLSVVGEAWREDEAGLRTVVVMEGEPGTQV
jgi:NADPH:quinone reductase-like Zn-dependent oxidoreductase